MTFHNNNFQTCEKQIKSFILKCALIQFTIAVCSCVAFSEQFYDLIADEKLGLALVGAAVWNVIGISFYLFYSQTKRIAAEAQKVIILVLFFAPTTSILIFGPMLNGCEMPAMPKISKLFSSEPRIETTVSMFFARLPIARGEALTAKNTIVLSVYPSDFAGGIIATKDNHFGDSKNKNSMLLRKCIYPIEAGSPIRDSDIEPHYQ